MVYFVDHPDLDFPRNRGSGPSITQSDITGPSYASHQLQDVVNLSHVLETVDWTNFVAIRAAEYGINYCSFDIAQALNVLIIGALVFLRSARPSLIYGRYYSLHWLVRSRGYNHHVGLRHRKVSGVLHRTPLCSPTLWSQWLGPVQLSES